MSPTSLVPAVSEVKSRLTRSGRCSASSAGIVVRFFVRGWMPAIPAWRMIERTIPSEAGTPSAVRSARTRRCPLMPLEAAWLSITAAVTSARRVAAGPGVSPRFTQA